MKRIHREGKGNEVPRIHILVDVLVNEMVNVFPKQLEHVDDIFKVVIADSDLIDQERKKKDSYSLQNINQPP